MLALVSIFLFPMIDYSFEMCHISKSLIGLAYGF